MPEFVHLNTDIIEPFFVDEPVDFVYHFASPASPIDYLRLPLHTLKVGSYGTHHALGLAKHHRARFLLASTSEVYGDPAGASAAGVLLGPREPDRPARRLRRGQALRRGADDGLPPPAGRGHGDRADLQHLRPAHAPARRPRDPDVPAPGAAGPADHRVRRRVADALVLLRRRPDRRASSALPSPAYHQPVNIGNPERVHAARARAGGDRGHRVALGDRLRGAARRRSRRSASRTSRSRARCSAGSPRSSCARACAARSRPSGVEALAGTGLARARAGRTPRENRYSAAGSNVPKSDAWADGGAGTQRRMPRRAQTRAARSPARARRAPQAPAGALLPAADGDAAPRLARRCRCWRSTSPRLSPRIFTALMVKAVVRGDDWAWDAVLDETRRTVAFAYLVTRAAVRPLGPVRRARAAPGPAADRRLAVPGHRRGADLRAGQRASSYSSYYIFYGTLFFAIVYVGIAALGSTSGVTGVLLRAAGYRRRAVLVGSGKHIEEVAHALRDEVHAPVEMVGFISLDAAARQRPALARADRGAARGARRAPRRRR